MRRSRRIVMIVVGVLVVAGIMLTAQGAYIPAKAWLAQHLLERAWRHTQAGRPGKPWPWADTRPVARLSVPRLGRTQILLAGAHGRALAFGPGHLDGTALPGRPGHSVISAHRDTHFAFLKDIRTGDNLVVETSAGRRRAYRVVDRRIMDTRHAGLSYHPDQDLLALVTCYPFENWRAGGPLRYLVTAAAVDRKSSTAGPTTAAYQALPAALK